MGRSRKRFNEKGRTITPANYHGNEDQIEVDFQELHKTKYDDSNPLVLSGLKKEKKAHYKEEKREKCLSKKQRKKLEKVIERKQKKLNRVELLQKLSQVQANPEETSQLISTANVHTIGLKKFSKDPERKNCIKVSNLKGLNKLQHQSKKAKIEYDLEEDSSDSSGEETLKDVDEDNNKNIEKETSTVNATELQISTENETTLTGHSPIKDILSSASLKTTENDTTVKLTAVDSSIVDVPADSIKSILQEENHPQARVPAVYIQVSRKPEIQAAREALPIFCEEQSLVEAIKENQIVIVHGETGSGKTTQVPQFLYESGFTLNNKIIGITEPRRIAAITMSSRVGEELNMPEKVSFHIRYKKTIGSETEIKFMTDGVLLQEIKHDFFLTKYSVIIIDEAHERSIFSDVLIGLLSRIVPVRAKRNDPLKLIIMSATIRVQDFTENSKLFKTEPVLIKLDSRQYKVQVHFNKHTPEDYIEAAYNKVSKIHRTLPSGAILVFLTGENEIQKLCKQLKHTFKFANNEVKASTVLITDEAVTPTSRRKRKRGISETDDSFSGLTTEINLDNYSIEPLNVEDLQHQQSDGEEDETEFKNFQNRTESCDSPLYVLPLYSFLPVEEQEKVFKPPPAGARLCVVSTNVAETSITIPGLKYVVDSGKVKRKVYNSKSGGISKFEIDWCSKASANQRAGRCGRTEGGHCYRLYSSAVFENDLPNFDPPDIQQIPVDDILLQMKALGIDRVVEFPFPSPPQKEFLMAAEKRLVLLGALEDLQKKENHKDLDKWEFSARITPLGKKLSRFPLSPRFAKMLLLSHKHKCIPHIIAIVCGLTVPQLFLTTTTVNEEDKDQVTVSQEGVKKIGVGSSTFMPLGDVMVLLRAVAMFEESKNKAKFCIRNKIRHKAMSEIHKMSIQLIREINREFCDVSLPLQPHIPCPTDEEVETLRKIITICFLDHVAWKIPREEAKDEKSLKNAYKCQECEEPVFIHPSSVIFERLPEYIVYSEIVQSSKFYMKGVVEIEPEWIAVYAAAQCSFSEPYENPPPFYDSKKDKIICKMGATFGRRQWNLPEVSMEMPKGLLKYTWFCFFFLDGQIFSQLNDYKADLLSQPSVMHKSWAKLLPRTRYLLEAVITKELDSKEKLKQVWAEDPNYLLREYQEWLPTNKHLDIQKKWPCV